MTGNLARQPVLTSHGSVYIPLAPGGRAKRLCNIADFTMLARHWIDAAIRRD